MYNHLIVKAFLLLLSGFHITPLYAVLYQCRIYIHPERKDALYLFGDLHIDLSDMKKATEQVEQLHVFINNLPNPKEVLVEDAPTLISEESQETTRERWFIKQGPQGKQYKFIQATPLFYATLGYGLLNIPVYNVEIRHSPTAFKKAIAEIERYDDGPIFNAYYRNALDIYKKYGLTFMGELRILDAYLLHRMHHNINQDYQAQILLAGGLHIDNIIPTIEQLGYQKVADQGITTQEALQIMDKYRNQAISLSRESKTMLRRVAGVKTSSKKAREKIDTLYLEMMDALALDLSTLNKYTKHIEKEREIPVTQPLLPSKF